MQPPLFCTPAGRLFYTVAGLLVYAIQAPPTAAQTLRPDDGALWHTVGDRALERLRGGFDIGGGLQVNFGITRTVHINGALVTQTTLNLGDLSRLTSTQAARLHSQVSELNLVQTGPRNSITADLASLRNGLVIQNTLNNQQINAQTTINASSNGLGMVRNMNLQSAVDDALHRAVGPR